MEEHERIKGFREEDWTARDIRVDRMDKGKMIGNTFVFCEECLGGKEVGMMMGETGVFKAIGTKMLSTESGSSSLSEESCEDACWHAPDCIGKGGFLDIACVHDCQSLCDDSSGKVTGTSSGASEKDISSPEYPFMDLGDLPPGLDSKPDYSAEEYRSPFDDRELYDGEDDVLLRLLSPEAEPNCPGSCPSPKTAGGETWGGFNAGGPGELVHQALKAGVLYLYRDDSEVCGGHDPLCVPRPSIGNAPGADAEIWITDDAFTGYVLYRQMVHEILHTLGADQRAAQWMSEVPFTDPGCADDVCDPEAAS